MPCQQVANKSFSFRRGSGGCRLPALLGVLILLLPPGAGAFEMRGPAEADQRVSAAETMELSPLKIGLQGLVRLFQQVVSPVNPDRCGFRPSCSAYGALAVRDHGPFRGVLLTADRLLRCHHLKKPGYFTLLLPDGKILDLPPDKAPAEASEP